MSLGADAWDDTELIQAYEDEIRQYKQMHLPGHVPPVEEAPAPEEHDDAQEEPQEAYSETYPSFVPSQVLPEDEELANLLMAWYYAGYVLHLVVHGLMVCVVYCPVQTQDVREMSVWLSSEGFTSS